MQGTVLPWYDETGDSSAPVATNKTRLYSFLRSLFMIKPFKVIALQPHPDAP
jgi:hypothetical protein